MAATGSVQSAQGAASFYKVDLSDGTKCCSYQTRYGIPCAHQCRLAAAVGIDPLSLAVNELTRQHDQVVYSRALPVAAMSTMDLQEEDLQPPAKKRQRGAPKKKRIRSGMDTTPLPAVSVS